LERKSVVVGSWRARNTRMWGGKEHGGRYGPPEGIRKERVVFSKRHPEGGGLPVVLLYHIRRGKRARSGRDQVGMGEEREDPAIRNKKDFAAHLAAWG